MNDGHAAGPKAQLKNISILLGGLTAFSLLFYLLTGIFLPLLGVGIGWAVVGIYSLILLFIIEPGGDALGRVIVSSGSSTPSVSQHSNIETMVTRGEYAKAAQAYQGVIASSPQDLVACDKLARLAMGELKDYPLAVSAYREAEKRSPEPRRQAGYALLVAGIYRDNLKDYGKSMVELRRILARYPDVPNRDRLTAEIEELKALHFEAS